MIIVLISFPANSLQLDVPDSGGAQFQCLPSGTRMLEGLVQTNGSANLSGQPGVVHQVFYLPSGALDNEGPGFTGSLVGSFRAMPHNITRLRDQP